jgi:Predicted Fe-S oxidoreductases
MNNKYKGLFCPVPFEFIYIDDNGNMNPHCEGLVAFSMGSLKEGSFFDVWNSDIAQKIRESILDESFQFCDEQRCFALRERKLPNAEKINNQVHRDIINNKLAVLKNGPKAVNFGYDSSCNLSCQSCRKDYSLSHEDLKAAEIIHQKVVGKNLKDTKRLVLSGMGDPFASRLYRKFLQDFSTKEFPQLKLQIVTNGLMLTPDMWKTLSNSCGAIDKISISIDAATEKTYKKIRGGDFKTLEKNLGFISRIRRRKCIKVASAGVDLYNPLHENR